MDDIRTDIVEAGSSGPESNAEHDIRAIINDTGIVGAIDPDAARNAGDAGEIGDDFAAAFASEPAVKVRRGRGPNKKGRKQSEDAKEAPLNINGVEKILFSLHGIASSLSNIPELELDEGEAKKLAKGIEGVTNQYKLTIDPKIAAWIDLGTTCSMIYGPRAFTFYVRKKTEAEKKPKMQPMPSNVQDIRPNMQPARPQAGMDASGFNPGKIIDS